MRHDFRIEQRPDTGGFDAFHEQIGYPIGEVEVVSAAGLVTRVFAQLEKILYIGMP
jgi:hypothetical protein